MIGQSWTNQSGVVRLSYLAPLIMILSVGGGGRPSARDIAQPASHFRLGRHSHLSGGVCRLAHSNERPSPKRAML